MFRKTKNTIKHPSPQGFCPPGNGGTEGGKKTIGLGWAPFGEAPFGEALFFVMMYILGIVTEIVEVPDTKNAHLYANLWLELFVDLSLICLFLRLLPLKIRRWVRLLFAVIAYAFAFVDVYCYAVYQTNITPAVLLLVAETNPEEASEFLSTIFTSKLIFSQLGWVELVLVIHIALAIVLPKLKCLKHKKLLNIPPLRRGLGGLLGGLLLVLFIWGVCASWQNKCLTYKLMSGKTVGEIEHTLTEPEKANLYQPILRFMFSYYANSLAGKQLDVLRKSVDEAKVDSCSFTSPNIVLIIGESYSRHHSHMYGYWQPTTPRQEQLEQQGDLVKFTDVVSPWNLTSFVFKLMFTTYTVGDKGDWCDYPLFPALFRKAGYHVTFLTNQFLPRAKQAVYDMSGGFFLNDPSLSKAQFDTRNSTLFRYDGGLLNEYDRMVEKDSSLITNHSSLFIFHLAGQHVAYKQRSPFDRKVFHRDEYKESKPWLSDKERQTLSDYDNAILYNDSIVTAICQKFDKKDAIIIYIPDHGEECYEGKLHFICRMHSAKIDRRLAETEFEIPMWIYATKEYQHLHPEIWRQVKGAKDKRFMTDATSHLLLYLAGIHTKSYRDDLNLLSPRYNEKRPRILKKTTDYDKLK